MQLVSYFPTFTSFDDEMTSLIVDVIHLQTWIPSIVQLFAERIHDRKQQLYILMMADLPSITTDVSALEEILVELLTHTCNCTPAGELITVSADATDYMMQISVSSSGINLSALELPQTCDVFCDMPETTLHYAKQLNLTSPTIQSLVQQLQGSLLLETTVSQTTFTLQFPYETTVSSAAADQDERILLAGASARF